MTTGSRTTIGAGWPAGPTDSLVDIPGVRVGHASRVGDGWLTGVTVVLAPPGGAVAGVDVRGGAPGTRETDLLDPRDLVERVHAIVLSGGSAFGLAAADGVHARLADDGVGFRVGPEPDQVVPIVPAAVVFDLGRGGRFRATPDAALGAEAYAAARGAGGAAGMAGVAQGSVGAGTGTVAGGFAGGIGTASVVLGGYRVAALAVVNAAGSAIDPRTGLPYTIDPYAIDAGGFGLRRPDQAELDAWGGPPTPGTFNTTIGVVATDAPLTKAGCAKLAGVAHDGLARAVRPVHTMTDGDTIFALATGDGPPLTGLDMQDVLIAAADCFAVAVTRGVLAATDHPSVGGLPGVRSYASVLPSAFRP